MVVVEFADAVEMKLEMAVPEAETSVPAHDAEIVAPVSPDSVVTENCAAATAAVDDSVEP